MKRWTFTRVTLLLMLLLACLTTASAQEKDAEEERLHDIVLTCFDNSDREAFYKANNEYRAYVEEKGYEEKYYNSWNNEILYDINNDLYYQALKKTEEMENILKKNEAKDYYHLVNYLKGVFYGTRENNDLCREYLMKALEQTDPEKNNADQVAIYQMLANISIFEEGEEGYKWSDKAIAICKDNYGLAGSLGVKAMVAFTHRDKDIFDDCYARIDSIKRAAPDDYHPIYEVYMEMGRRAFNGEYEKAIAITDSILSESERLGFLAVIQHIKGDLKAENEALIRLINAKERRNNEISVLTVNEISRDIELTNERHQRRRAELYTIIAIFAFLGVIIILLSYFGWTRRKHLALMKAQNRELEQARDHAEESDRMKTAFIRNVSHQIRTPLNAVSGFSQILATQNDELAEDERQDLAQRIEHNTNVITNSLNHMIALSEVESVHISDAYEPVSCNAFCEEIAQAFKPQNERLAFSYTSSVSDKAKVTTNKEMLKSIVQELLFNAEKFTKEGKIILANSLEDNLWKISVTDTGEGIAAENIENIFGKFSKVDDFSEGLGLGLTFCKSIALQLGGDVTVDKDYHEGARFIVSIPQG